ncbi:MAG: tetratricopeptide repeat protein, partial [Planctomycetes bacterium]|nr:tetratricopeptide repeat protein [Planctomycetota bacterium]
MMRSTKIAAIFILLSLGLLGQMLSPPDGLAQGQQEDTIVYSTDGTTIMEAKGTIIKESFKGVELKTRKFKLNEIKNIKYANQPYKYFNAQNSQSQREYDKAIKVYQEILEDIKSSKTRALFKQHMLFNIARCYQSDRKFGQAVKAYEHLLKEIPDTRYFREAYENIAQCYLAQKDITKAVAAMVEARKQGSAAGLDQESLLKFDLLKANILENNGQPDQAQPLYANISQQATNL